ncbi:MAG: sulfatase, partial [Woeseiaceae bacterium]|nr:sulfatase [Woeseiaceae bacterium]
EKLQVRASLRKKLDKWIVEVGARLPQLNPRYDDKLAERAKRDMRTKRLPQLERQHAGFLKADYKPNATWWGSTPD